MDSIKWIAGVLALSSVSAFFGIASYEMWRTGEHINSKTGILARAEGLEQKGYATLKNLDDVSGQLKDAAGDWSDASKQEAKNILDLTQHADNTIDGVDDIIDTANDQIARLEPILKDADMAVKGVPPVLDSVKKTVNGLQPDEDALKKTIDDLDMLAKDKNIKESLVHLNAGMDATASSMKHVDGILADGQKEADRLVAPAPWWKRLEAWSQLGANAAIRYFTR